MNYKVILESSIMQKGKPATAGSKMLESFISPIDATVMTRLEDADVSIIGRAEMDEFGASGLFATVSLNDKSQMANDKTQMTKDKSCDIGKTGDSSLSCSNAELLTEAVNDVAGDKADIALCNDYTGAVSHAAATRGVCYIHPTYGTVSRYGLIPVAPSIDQIGVVCRTPADGFNALRLIAGYDSKDGAMFSDEARTAGASSMREKPPQLRISYVKPKYSEIYTQLMQILCCAELSNNISRYDGVKFGYRTKDYSSLRELYTKSRTEAFSADVKLAAIIGAMVLSQENYTRYYEKAMQLRRLIRDSLEFDKYDLICETNSETGETEQDSRDETGHGYLSHSDTRASNISSCVLLSRLCGLPSVVTPDCIYVANVGCENILEEMCKGISCDEQGLVSGGKAL